MRDELLPSGAYRRAWTHFCAHLDADRACKHIVGAWAMAARHDGEKALGDYLQQCIDAGRTPRLFALARRFGPPRRATARVTIVPQALHGDDALVLSNRALTQEVAQA